MEQLYVCEDDDNDGNYTITQISSFSDTAFRIDIYQFFIKDGVLYFLGGPDSWYNLFSWDGVSINQETLFTNPSRIAESAIEGSRMIESYANNIYFSAGSTSDGVELWVYDGLSESIAYDFFDAGEGLYTFGGYPMGLKGHDGYLFFQAYKEGSGNMLYLYDGINTPVGLIDTNVDDNTSSITYTMPFTVIDDDMVFMDFTSEDNIDFYRLTIEQF